MVMGEGIRASHPDLRHPIVVNADLDYSVATLAGTDSILNASLEMGRRVNRA
jgi:hypothetical protein